MAKVRTYCLPSSCFPGLNTLERLHICTTCMKSLLIGRKFTSADVCRWCFAVASPSNSFNASHLTALRDGDFLIWLVFTPCAHIFDLLHRVHAVYDFAEDHMFPVKKRCWYSRDEELTAICVRARVLLNYISPVISYKGLRNTLTAIDNKPAVSWRS